MQYSGIYNGMIHSYCDQFNYTDQISFSIDHDGNINLPPFIEGSLQGGKVDSSGNIIGSSITVNSLSLGQLKIPYSGTDDGIHFSVSGTSVNGIVSTIQAVMTSSSVSDPVYSPITITDNGDGTHSIAGRADDLTILSIGNDVMTGGGVRETFVFTPGFGQNEITDFNVMGQDHDTIDLSATRYNSLAEVLRHTSMSDGSATIHLNPHDSITLDGVTKGQLKAHPNDFVFG